MYQSHQSVTSRGQAVTAIPVSQFKVINCTSMKLHNTPAKTITDIQPQSDSQVTVYTCGPTVYDYPHIGNWFTFVRYDLLIRALKAEGLKPNWVMNITDVGHLVSDADDGEDKLERGAKREGKTAWEVAEFYTENFLQGLQKLNITKPDVLPKATDHIQEQIDLVKRLEEKDFTYVIDDGVYFDTTKFPRYAEFAGLNLDEQEAGARVEVNQQKRSQTDFALWKFSPEGQKRDMEWDNPWDQNRKGFPGWHLECSAMSMKYLGETLDIHAGGIDHIPVHHTNEIAQSEAATGKPFVNHWMHANHIMVEGQKISKSLSNGITLEDIEAKGIDLRALRLLILASHYRSQSQFTWENLQSMQSVLERFLHWSDLQFQGFESPELAASYKSDISKFSDEISNDLGTPSALAVLNGMVTRVDELGADSKAIGEVLTAIDAILGIGLNERKDITSQQRDLLQRRQEARQQKDWKLSDQLRDELATEGIGIKDTSYGQTWFRI